MEHILFSLQLGRMLCTGDGFFVVGVLVSMMGAELFWLCFVVLLFVMLCSCVGSAHLALAPLVHLV